MAEKTFAGLYQMGDDVTPPLMIFGLPLKREPVKDISIEKIWDVENIDLALSAGLAHNTRHDHLHYEHDIKDFSRYLARDIVPHIPGVVDIVLTEDGISQMREAAFINESGEILASGFLYGKEFQDTSVPLIDNPELVFYMLFRADAYPDALSDVFFDTNTVVTLMNIQWNQNQDADFCLYEDVYPGHTTRAAYRERIKVIQENAFDIQARSILKLPHVRLNQDLIEAFARLLKKQSTT